VVTVIRTTPNSLGSFTVQCSQLCGLYHAFMNNQGAVVTPTQFAQWLESHGASPTAAANVAGTKNVLTSAVRS
jgi:heme/copper-type cytochrome/quinol oxidase subunit 2